jgi:hypothetical protein
MARWKDYYGSDVDPLDHRFKCEGSLPTTVLSKNGLRLFVSTMHQRSLWRGRKREVRLQGSLCTGWRSAPCLSTLSWQANEEELPHTGHRVCGGPRRKFCTRNAYELGELPHQRIIIKFPRSPKLGI